MVENGGGECSNLLEKEEVKSSRMPNFFVD